MGCNSLACFILCCAYSCCSSWMAFVARAISSCDVVKKVGRDCVLPSDLSEKVVLCPLLTPTRHTRSGCMSDRATQMHTVASISRSSRNAFLRFLCVPTRTCGDIIIRLAGIWLGIYACSPCHRLIPSHLALRITVELKQ